MRDAEWTTPRKEISFEGEAVWGPDRNGHIRAGRTIEPLAQNRGLAMVHWDDELPEAPYEYVLESWLAPTRGEAERFYEERTGKIVSGGGSSTLRSLRRRYGSRTKRDQARDEDKRDLNSG